MFKRFAALAALALGAAFAAPFAAPAAANAAATCTTQIGGACGAYSWSGWPGSNGYNSYVVDQAVNVQNGSTGSVTATSPSSWTTTANYTPCGGCVQTFNAVQQLTNNWGNSGFNGSSDLPMTALPKFQVKYAETPATGTANQYEFSPDLWFDQYGNCGGCGDIMMWVDTSPQRCQAVGGWNVLGHPVVAKRHWTAYDAGAQQEVIFILNAPGGSASSCAQQHSGTIHAMALLKWLSNHPGETGFPAFNTLTMTQANTGYEITAGNGAPYNVTNLAYLTGLAP